jgi:hypothetical protein
MADYQTDPDLVDQFRLGDLADPARYREPSARITVRPIGSIADTGDGDTLLPPPRYPGQPSEGWNQGVRGVMGSIANTVATPGQAMAPQAPQAPGMWSDEDETIKQLNAQHQLDWGADTALGMVGAGTPFAQPGALGAAGGRVVQKARPSIAAPATIGRINPTAGDIDAIKAAADAFGHGAWPDAQRPLFKTTPEAYAETTQLVPQYSIRDRLPGPTGKELPDGGRAQPIMDASKEIGAAIAKDLRPMVKADDPEILPYRAGDPRPGAARRHEPARG